MGWIWGREKVEAGEEVAGSVAVAESVCGCGTDSRSAVPVRWESCSGVPKA